MSTKTNFKRIALVAVAALGLGVLSSVPSNAAVSGLTVTVTNGSAKQVGDGASDTTTAAKFTIAGFVGAADSITAYVVLKSTPTVPGTVIPVLYNLDSTTPSLTTQVVDSLTTLGLSAGQFPIASKFNRDTVSATVSSGVGGVRISSTADANISHTFGLVLDSALSTTRTAGTYTYTLVVKTYETLPNVAGVATTTTTKDISIVVASTSTQTAAASTTGSGAYSTSIISSQSGGTWASTATDSVLAVAATSTGTAAAAVRLTLKNVNNVGSTVLDSVTVTIDKGNIGTSHTAALGKSIVVNYPASAQIDFFVFADGSTGTGTITLATKNAGTYTETISWYATDVKSIVASSYRSVIAVGAEATKGAVKVNAYDVNSTSFGAATAVYAYSSDTTVISDYGTACTWNTTDQVAYCALTGVKAGTANITYRDAATVALSTVASNAVAVRVSQGASTSFTLTTDKASYAPGEKGYLIVTIKDAAGLVMPIQSSVTVFASGGITTTAQLGSSSDTFTATSFSTDRSSTPSSTDPIKVYTFYAPVTSGAVTFSAKGASTYSAASQATATTTTVTVADSASAALAAVSALAVTVASLKTLITTLTNLVLKIQKKVKA